MKLQLKTLAWNEIVDSAYKPMWTETVDFNSNWLGKADAQGVFRMAQDMEETIKRIDAKAKLQDLAPEQVYFILQVLGAALAVRLLDMGYAAKIEIGSEWEFTKDGKKFNPFQLVHDASSGEMTPPEF